MNATIIQGNITSARTFADGNTGYTVRHSDGTLWGFTEAVPLHDDKKRALLPGSLIQAKITPVVDAEGHEVVREFQRRDGLQDQVARCRMQAWYLVEAAQSGDDKRSANALA